MGATPRERGWGSYDELRNGKHFVENSAGAVVGMTIDRIPYTSSNQLMQRLMDRGIPLLLWLGSLTLNTVQAVNAGFDQSPPMRVCTTVVKEEHLGCARSYQRSGTAHQLCDVLTEVQGWPGPNATIRVEGRFPDAKRICFSTHRGFLGLEWIDNVHAEEG